MLTSERALCVPAGVPSGHSLDATTGRAFAPPSPGPDLASATRLGHRFENLAARPAPIQRGRTNQNEKRKKRRRARGQVVTRILRQDQLSRRNIGTNSVRFSKRSLERNLPEHLTPSGRSTSRMSGLYSFMRKYGGAGIQGFHRPTPGRNRIVRNVLGKMRGDRQTRSSRGPKFAMVAVDTGRLPQDDVMDLGTPEVENEFNQSYGKYKNMYNTHKGEGVVGVRGRIPRKAVLAMRAFRGVPNKKQMDEILSQLHGEDEESDEEPLDLPDEDEADPSFHGFGGPKGPPPSSGGMGGGILVND
ncbi:MAG TPA: hypothetical protein VN783_05535 [Thermoanaerobaculia bacterium]|nr:hypothetical protein [Thermoanaerobaculia bacterium]